MGKTDRCSSPAKEVFPVKLDVIIAKPNHKTVYRDGDVVIKVFDECFDKADVLNEALNQARVEKSPLHIPRVRGVELVDGKWAIISDYIQGKTLDSLMQEHPENRGDYLGQFVDLQRLTHSQACPLLGRFRDKLHQKINASDLDVHLRYALHTRLETMPTHTKLCHGDFNPKNIIMTEDGTPYILDWSHAAQGNASADVAQTYLLFSLGAYREEAEKYLNLFCKMNDVTKRYVTKWIPIVAASQLGRCKPEEKPLLMKWVESVREE